MEDEEHLITISTKSINCYHIQRRTCQSLDWNKSGYFSRNGSRLMTWDLPTIKVWDLIVGETFTIRECFSIPNVVEPSHRQMDISADGNLFCFTSSDVIHIWDVDRQSLIARLVVTSSKWSPITLSFSPDGQNLLDSSAHGVRIWNLRKLNKNINVERQIPLVPSCFPPPISPIWGAAMWGRDGKSVLWRTRDGSVEGWSVDGQPLFSLNGNIVSGE